MMSANEWENAARRMARKHGLELQIAVALVVGVSLLFSLVVQTYRDHSYQLMMASYIQLLGLLVVAREIHVTRSARGLSLHMILCYLMAVTARFCSIGFENHYMPGDHESEHRMYQILEFATLATVAYIAYQARVQYYDTYDLDLDQIKPLHLALPALVLACVYGPNWNESSLSNVAWSFALYLEAVAVMPQLVMFTMGKKPASFMAHFLFVVAVAKALAFGFWSWYFYTYAVPECIYIVGSQAVQLVIMGDFIYRYVHCVASQIPLPLLLSESV